MRGDKAISPGIRKLLLVELLLCLGPVVALFAVALVMAPFQIYMLLVDEESQVGNFLHLAWFLFCGICGLSALWRTSAWLFRGCGEIQQPMFVCFGIALGLIPIAGMAASASRGWQLLAALPLLAVAHVVVLCRSSLFRWIRPGQGHA